ncbi:hypothetical protein ACFFKE_32410 [Streptomyces mutabilis]|uniref:hypothetical protein n=1 Tax=Streptomyces mutabilis TaxID=67332 RepID=UPI0017832F5D|nr:hypothetical protein [Streptomyces mutabilis]GGQ38586.1 hypothetical protein GCM10010279_54900 [Streptomyces mutabilis]
MADLVTNLGKGRHVYYAAQAQAGTGGAVMRAVVLEAAGLEADDALQDYDTLAALLAGASNEQTTMGRKALTGVTVTVDDAGNKASWTAGDLVWTDATGNATGKIVICYDPTGAGTDADLLPLTLHDFAVTPDGTSITASVGADGIAVSENPA